jgi:hypothetical protein
LLVGIEEGDDGFELYKFRVDVLVFVHKLDDFAQQRGDLPDALLGEGFPELVLQGDEGLVDEHDVFEFLPGEGAQFEDVVGAELLQHGFCLVHAQVLVR